MDVCIEIISPWAYCVKIINKPQSLSVSTKLIVFRSYLWLIKKQNPKKQVTDPIKVMTFVKDLNS